MLDLKEEIYKNQKRIVKTEECYYVDNEPMKRVSNVIGNTFTGDSSKYEDSRIAGSRVDCIVRDLLMGEFKFDNYANIWPETFNQFVYDFKSIMQNITMRGEEPLTDNIMVFNKDIAVAGEMDILTLSDEGPRIYDTKTALKSAHSDSYLREYEGNGLKRSKKDQHTMQLNAYASLFYAQYGVWPVQLGILPIKIDYYWKGDSLVISQMDIEKGISIEYTEEIKKYVPYG